MVNLIDRELKFFFTSPLFMGLELASAALVAYIMYYSTVLSGFVNVNLLPVAWVIIVLYSTYFELEIWRRGFLNNGVKLKIYASKSEYTPFLAHSLVSLILLELKTLIVLISLQTLSLDLMHFLLATHGYWLFSLSVGYVLSKEVLRRLASSTAIFLCVLIPSVTALLSTLPGIFQSQNQSPSTNFLDAFKGLSLIIIIIFLVSLLLYVLALYACSRAVRNIRIDDI